MLNQIRYSQSFLNQYGSVIWYIPGDLPETISEGISEENPGTIIGSISENVTEESKTKGRKDRRT